MAILHESHFCRFKRLSDPGWMQESLLENGSSLMLVTNGGSNHFKNGGSRLQRTTRKRGPVNVEEHKRSGTFSHKPTTVCFIGCFRNTSARQTTLQLQGWRVASKYTSPASFTGRPILLWSASKAFEKIHTVQTKSEEVKKHEESTEAGLPVPCR